jgi:hypothetical protein
LLLPDAACEGNPVVGTQRQGNERRNVKRRKVALREDVDESGRFRILLSATLPAEYPLDRHLVQNRRYHERLVQTIPLSHCPYFALLTEFMAGPL